MRPTKFSATPVPVPLPQRDAGHLTTPPRRNNSFQSTRVNQEHVVGHSELAGRALLLFLSLLPRSLQQMDAHALLKSQGWRGSGHSLHKSDDSIGLAKPILTSRKNNTLGIGRKNHVTSDQWWLNALDEQLKGLDTSSKTSIVQTKQNTKLEGLLTSGAGKYTGANALYAHFVSGGLLQGTLQTEGHDESTDATPEAEVPAPVKKETKEEKRARREERRRRKAKKLATESAAAAEIIDKESSKNKDKSKSKSKAKSKSESNSGSEKNTKLAKKSGIPETKAERRARKEAKRKQKAKKDKKRKVEEG